MTLRLLTYNIRYGGKGREDSLISVIRACHPDIVVLQEATRPDVVERLGAGAGLPVWRSRPRESLGFLSRLPIAHYEWHRPRMSRHSFLEIVPEGDRVRIFGVHLSAVHAAWTERRRTVELRALLKSIERHQSGFHILTGDFNTLSPDEILDVRKLPYRLRALVWLSGGRVRLQTIQVVLTAGYHDVFRSLHPGTPGMTFPTWDPHVRLDYFFVPGRDVSRALSCQVVENPQVRLASDHFPVIAEFAL